MSLETYDELKVSLKNWLDRDDLDPFLGDFIKLAESRFNRQLRLRAMERKEKTDTVGGQSNYILPNDFLQGREFRLNTSITKSLQYITQRFMSHGILVKDFQSSIPWLQTNLNWVQYLLTKWKWRCYSMLKFLALVPPDQLTGYYLTHLIYICMALY